MKLTIHRGTREIGGSCVKIQSSSSRILIDLGLPLVDENRERFDAGNIKDKSKAELIKSRILPDIKGLYKHEGPAFDGILLSHAHQDHYGLLSFVNSQIPIYLSDGCKELIEISRFFGQTDIEPINVQTLKSWQSFSIGDFKVAPYLVDHSAFDAMAFLIEAEGKKLFYSGDFRGHGRKSVLFEKMLDKPIRDITCLMLEGSMFGRDKGEYQTETDLENKLVELLADKEKLYFVACSSQNIDRLVSIYRACVRTGRIFVIDPYTAYILDRLKKISSNIPQFDWGENIKIFFVPNTYTEKMAEDKSLFKFKSAKITYDEMQAVKDRLVIKDTYKTRWIFSKKKDLSNTTLIYSLWSGYLPDVRPFWDENNVPVIEVHCSGHAYIEDLKDFVRALKPEYIIPIHTFYPEDYSKHLGSNIKIVEDRDTVKI
jgi:ribonuclease J